MWSTTPSLFADIEAAYRPCVGPLSKICVIRGIQRRFQRRVGHFLFTVNFPFSQNGQPRTEFSAVNIRMYLCVYPSTMFLS
jgi:hypothetical protein